MMARLDCFSGYHQIWLHKGDEKTRFITRFGTTATPECPKVCAMQGQLFAK
jgi:hypothetical protein